jgi:hypothetical protein
MKKPKILKKLPKSPKKFKKNTNFKSTPKPQDNFTENYLKFYDDVKIPSKRYDW